MTQGGTGTITNGMFTGGLPGKKPGEYDSLKYMQYGPRVGFAWDVFGNGKTAIRGASGIFYNFFSCCNYPYNGGPLISVTRNVINGTIPQITEASQSGNLAVSPQNAGIPIELGATKYLAGQDIQPTDFQASLHYQANVAVQRDIGFNTVVEVAYVGNWGRHYYQGKTVNNIPVDAYANTANLFNNDAIAANFIRRNFAGMGALTYVTSDYTGLDYNSLQISAQRRLSHGLQMGGSYTLAKGMGMRGWDFRTEELGGMAALRDIYYGPQIASDQGQERRHVAVLNYSYQIPTIDKAVLKYILGGWEVAGVSTFVSGDAVNPTCGTGSGISGIANTDPSLSGVSSRCELVPGQSLTSGYDPTGGVAGVAFEDQAHFNLNAFQRPLPTNTAFSTTGEPRRRREGQHGQRVLGPAAQPGLVELGRHAVTSPADQGRPRRQRAHSAPVLQPVQPGGVQCHEHVVLVHLGQRDRRVRRRQHQHEHRQVHRCAEPVQLLVHGTVRLLSTDGAPGPEPRGFSGAHTTPVALTCGRGFLRTAIVVVFRHGSCEETSRERP